MKLITFKPATRLRYNKNMKFNILTIFPKYFDSVLNESIIKRAIQDNKITVNIIDIRKYATDKHQITDDRPFGGGPGMVMKIEPIFNALKKNNLKKGIKGKKVLLTSAKGLLFNQQTAVSYSRLDEITIICGHYEGVDERVAENLIDEEIRIGDYVLTGGEPAANVLMDAVTRLVPQVLGNEESNQNESHSQPGMMSHPQYTRPEEFNTWKVPNILLSGDHGKIHKWREENSNK